MNLWQHGADVNYGLQPRSGWQHHLLTFGLHQLLSSVTWAVLGCALEQESGSSREHVYLCHACPRHQHLLTGHHDVQEFQKCGDMLQFGTFGAVSRCNWIYIQYQARASPEAADRGLLDSPKLGFKARDSLRSRFGVRVALGAVPEESSALLLRDQAAPWWAAYHVLMLPRRIAPPGLHSRQPKPKSHRAVGT